MHVRIKVPIAATGGSFKHAYMTNMGILHDRLHGGLWHTTHPDRFVAILASGGLTAEPDIPNSERWKASRPEYYPFVRCLSGVSLFDFAEFEPVEYERTHPLCNWHEFVPYRKTWGGAVWIEIDRIAPAGKLISANELVAQWDHGRNWKHTIMPRIEAAHIGDIPLSAFRSAFITWDSGYEVREISLSNFAKTDFHHLLHEWRMRQAAAHQ